MAISTKITMPVRSFRRIENPAEQEGKKIYLAVVRAKDLPAELRGWRKINPREANLKSGVARKIRESLKDQPEQFLFRNRGLTILADKVNFDNGAGELALEFADEELHGLLDGGHTYAVIREAFESLDETEKSESNLDGAYVKLEIIEGFSDTEETTAIVGARNTSMQVQDQSIDNLLKRFDGIKDVLNGRSYADKIAYKEIELNDEGGKKNIDVRDLLSYLTCFDREGFGDNEHPIMAYSGKAKTLKYAEDNLERLQKYLPLLPEILELRDEIYLQMPGAWNQNNGKFGRIEGVDKKKHGKAVELPFSGKTSEYVIPSSFIYPVLAAFRNLVKVREDETCAWEMSPNEFFEKHKDELVRRLVNQALVFKNPNRLGKDKNTWQLCYDYVLMEMLKTRR